MPDLLAPTDAPDFQTDDSSLETPFPDPPDFARYLPVSMVEDAQRQADAERFSAEQQQRIGALWSSYAQDRLDQTVQNYLNLSQWQPPSGPTTYEPVTPQAVEAPPQPAQPDAGSLIDRIFGGLGDLAGKLANSGAANVAGKMLGAGEGPAPGLPPEIHPEATGLTQEQVASAAPDNSIVQNYPELEKAGQAVANAALMTPGIAGQIGEGVNMAKGAVEDARLTQSLGENLQIPIMSGGSEDLIDATHPLVQKAADVTGIEPQKIADVLADPSQMDRITRTKNVARDLTPTQQVARTVYRASKDAQVAQAAPEGGVAASQAVVQAAPVHDPDPNLMDLLQQSIDRTKAAKGEAPALEPLLPEQQAVLSTVGELPPAAADAVVRDAARTALGETPTYAPDFRGRMQEVQTAPAMPPGEPPAATPDAAFTPPPADAGRITTGGGEPPQGIDYGLQPGQTPGGEQPPAGPLAGASFIRNSIPGLISGSASAGAVWTQDQDDALWRRLLLTGLAFKAGSAIPYAALGGPRAGMGGRFFQAFANNLLGPNVAALKGLTDVGSLVTDPAFNFVRSMVRGNGLQSSASEGLAYYQSLLQGNGVRDGLQAAGEALNPLKAAVGKTGQAGGTASLSEVTSTNNLRTINAIMKFWEPIMAQAEQAGMNATGVAAKGVERTFPLFIPGDVGRTTQTALDRAHAGMMMGEPEGAVGRMLLPVFKGIQQMGGAGKFVEPFANIPANLIDRGVSSTPLVGLLNGIGAKSPDAVIARQVMGTTAAMLTRGLFQTTGAGPSDPNLRSAWLKEGNQPYSVKLPWSDTWVPINKIPLLPLRGALTFDAALNDVKLNGGDGSAVSKFATSYGKALASDVFLPQLIQMGVALQKGDVSGVPSAVAGTIRMLLPMEGRLMAKAEEMVKPDVSGKPYRAAGADVADKVGSAVEAQVLANTPRGLGQAAPMPALTNTGQTEPNVQSGPSVISPVAPTKPTFDPVQEAFGRAGVDIPAPPTKLSINGRDVDLSGSQTQQFNVVRGEYLKAHLPANPTPQRLTSLLEQARNAAETDFRRNNPDAVRNAATTRQATQQKQAQKASDWGSWGSAGGASNTPSQPAIPAGSKPAAGWGSWGKAA